MNDLKEGLRNHYRELIISLIMIILLIIIINPNNIWGLKDTALMLVIALFAVMFAIFSVFMVIETPRDERENEHLAIASRVAFLVGTIFLALGIVIQSLAGNLDGWLPSTLIIMIVAKLISLLYLRIKR